jgi:hypothetical protein
MVTEPYSLTVFLEGLSEEVLERDLVAVSPSETVALREAVAEGDSVA